MILSERLQSFRQPEIPFAFFDFDGTLTYSDTLMPFLHHVTGVSYYPKLMKLSPILLAYVAKFIQNDVAKEHVLTEFIGQSDTHQIFQAACEFVMKKLPNLLLPTGMEKLYEHQNLGHYCILVSASPELYLSKWAQQHQFDGILATQLAVESGQFTGKLLGKNCFGAAKVERIETEYGADCWRNSFAYSDSLSDLPMLQCASKGFLLRKNQFVLI